jgi:hypothetical protein
MNLSLRDGVETALQRSSKMIPFMRPVDFWRSHLAISPLQPTLSNGPVKVVILSKHLVTP